MSKTINSKKSRPIIYSSDSDDFNNRDTNLQDKTIVQNNLTNKYKR